MILGADVNEYHPVLDIGAYLASGRGFLAFKATGGAKGWDYTDPQLAHHLEISQGVPRFAYHFLSQFASGVVQADHYLSKVPAQGVAHVVDFEFHRPSNTWPTLDHLHAWVDRVTQVTGRVPWVYTTSGVWNSLVPPDQPGPIQCPLWHADWSPPLGVISYGGWTRAAMWQYTNQANVPGVSGLCDDNQYFGDGQDLLVHGWGSTNVGAEDRGWSPCPTGSIVSFTAGGRSFSVHRRVKTIFEAFIHELTTRTDYPINEGTLDDWSYVCRKIAGTNVWSNHAFGLAVDINSIHNPWRVPLTTNMPAWVRDADYLMRKYGLRWGGTYQTKPDPMHFEFMLTPADADRLSAQLRGITPTVEEEVMAFYASKAEYEARMRELAALGSQDTLRQAVRGDPELPAAGYFNPLKNAVDRTEDLAKQLLAKPGTDTSAIASAVVAALEGKLPTGVGFTAADVAREIILQLGAGGEPSQELPPV